MIKTFESFVEDRNFRYEQEIIDPILNCIKDNQVYLTKPENLPQLAKLGYMYNTLWYAGRVCWGYDGVLVDKTKRKNDEEEDYGSCEDNPKYKIEMCDPNTVEIEDLIYDAWSLHATSDGPVNNFFDIIKNGKELSKLDKKLLKLNKTFEDWVEIKTDPDYRYKSLYPDRKSVADQLLCTLGGGYQFDKNGYIIETAGGADQDKAIYGDWQNAKFSTNIKKVVDSIIYNPQVKRTIDEYNKHLKRFQDEKNRRDNSWKDDIDKNRRDNSWKDDIDMSEIKALIAKLKLGGKELDVQDEPYRQYYPISSSSSIYAIINKETKDRLGIKKIHQSYIDAGTEICKEIIENKEREREENVEFAYKYLLEQGFTEYKESVPKEIDKYALLSEIEDCFLYVTDTMTRSPIGPLDRNEYFLYLNDTKDNQYADNNYNFKCSTIGLDIPEGLSTDINYIKDAKLRKNLKSALNRLKRNKDIKSIKFSINNIKIENYDRSIDIKIVVNDNYNHFKEEVKDEKRLEKLGFEVGSDYILLRCKDYILLTSKPKPLGSSHPNNKSGKDYYSLNKTLLVYDNNWVQKLSTWIDERHFNILTVAGKSTIGGIISSEYKKMKKSNPDYGDYDSHNKGKQGKSCLYAHDFMIWLKKYGI